MTCASLPVLTRNGAMKPPHTAISARPSDIRRSATAAAAPAKGEAKAEAKAEPAKAEAPKSSGGKAADLDSLRADLTGRVEALAQRLESIDGRITSISTELANQLTELGHDIDALANLPSNARAAIEESVLADLRDSQSRLANEQARYQIAFREDLAALAERLKRP